MLHSELAHVPYIFTFRLGTTPKRTSPPCLRRILGAPNLLPFESSIKLLIE